MYQPYVNKPEANVLGSVSRVGLQIMRNREALVDKGTKAELVLPQAPGRQFHPSGIKPMSLMSLAWADGFLITRATWEAHLNFKERS